MYIITQSPILNFKVKWTHYVKVVTPRATVTLIFNLITELAIRTTAVMLVPVWTTGEIPQK